MRSLANRFWKKTKETSLKSSLKYSVLFAYKEVIYFMLLRSRASAYLKNFLGEDLHMKLISHPTLKYWPNIKNPRTFNEKLLHRRLYTDNEYFYKFQNKDKVREYVKDRVDEEVLKDQYYVTGSPENIPFEDLPERYVIKSSAGAGSGHVLLIGQNCQMTEADIERVCEKWLSDDFSEYVMKGAYWFEDVGVNIIIEEMLETSNHRIPRDYKFYVFHGEVKYVHVDFDRHNDPSRRFFNRNWEPLEIKKGGVPKGPVIDRPENYDEMVNVAEELAKGFDFLRVDLYDLGDGGVIFGELTITPGGGRSAFEPQKYDYIFGSHW